MATKIKAVYITDIERLTATAGAWESLNIKKESTKISTESLRIKAKVYTTPADYSPGMTVSGNDINFASLTTLNEDGTDLNVGYTAFDVSEPSMIPTAELSPIIRYRAGIILYDDVALTYSSVETTAKNYIMLKAAFPANPVSSVLPSTAITAPSANVSVVINFPAITSTQADAGLVALFQTELAVAGKWKLTIVKPDSVAVDYSCIGASSGIPTTTGASSYGKAIIPVTLNFGRVGFPTAGTYTVKIQFTPSDGDLAQYLGTTFSTILSQITGLIPTTSNSLILSTDDDVVFTITIS